MSNSSKLVYQEKPFLSVAKGKQRIEKFPALSNRLILKTRETGEIT
jgi:hypothetical protein